MKEITLWIGGMFGIAFLIGMAVTPKVTEPRPIREGKDLYYIDGGVKRKLYNVPPTPQERISQLEDIINSR